MTFPGGGNEKEGERGKESSVVRSELGWMENEQSPKSVRRRQIITLKGSANALNYLR